LQAAGPSAYPHHVGTLDARPRSAITALIGAFVVWSVVSLMLPRTDMRSFVQDPAGARFGPLIVLSAIASDRPTTSLDAGTRSALMWLIGDVRFPASSIAISRLAAGLVRRGPPPSLPT
jgi:hypothetical protein